MERWIRKAMTTRRQYTAGPKVVRMHSLSARPSLWSRMQREAVAWWRAIWRKDWV